MEAVTVGSVYAGRRHAERNQALTVAIRAVRGCAGQCARSVRSLCGAGEGSADLAGLLVGDVAGSVAAAYAMAGPAGLCEYGR